MGARIPDDVRARVRTALESRGADAKPTFREIAAAHGISATSVKVIARAAGFDSSAHAQTQTKNAREARAASFAEQRRELAERLLREARAALDEIESGSVVTGMSWGEVVCKRVAHTTARDRRELLTAAAIAMDKHKMLDQYDADSGASDVDRFLKALTGRGDAA